MLVYQLLIVDSIKEDKILEIFGIEGQNAVVSYRLISCNGPFCGHS